MTSAEVEGLLRELLKRQRIIILCFLGSLALLVFTVVYGLKGINATAFLIEQGGITPRELLHTIRFWFWAIVASITNYAVFFATWYLSDKQLIRLLKQDKDRR